LQSDEEITRLRGEVARLRESSAELESKLASAQRPRPAPTASSPSTISVVPGRKVRVCMCMCMCMCVGWIDARVFNLSVQRDRPVPLDTLEVLEPERGSTVIPLQALKRPRRAISTGGRPRATATATVAVPPEQSASHSNLFSLSALKKQNHWKDSKRTDSLFFRTTTDALGRPHYGGIGHRDRARAASRRGSSGLVRR
jgi:hypothetical protein